MKSFNNKGFGGDRGGNFAKRPFSKPGFNKGGRDFGPRGDKQMFRTNCANCTKTCEVPFKPNGTKPVYCNDCFGKSDYPEKTFTKKDYGSSERTSAPRSAQSLPDARIDVLIRQMDAMQTKMDSLISAIESMNRPTQPVAVPMTAVQKSAKALKKAPSAKKVAVRTAKKTSSAKKSTAKPARKTVRK